MEPERFVRSSELECSGNRWVLKLYGNWYPYEDYTEDSEEASGECNYVTVMLDDANKQRYTSVLRVKVAFGPKDDPEKFYVVKTNGEVDISHSTCICQEKLSRYIAMSVQRSEVIKNSGGDIGLPDDILFIRCELKVALIKTSSDDIERAFQDETKKFVHTGSSELAENIGNAFEHGRLSDVTLKVGEHQFQAHKIILASRSRVFDGMFDSGMKESKENVVEILDMELSTAKEMLQYIYTGKLEELTMERALVLYVAADRYDLQELRRWCKEFILENVSHHDVCRVAELAELHTDEDLAKAARRVFKENSKIILISKTWRDFAKNNPVLYSNIMEETLLSES
ncbi:speckle-type POZ protein-like [Uloborus diversus]|uniref:speckle-type POZ protein-like n=1 Tax=Uloborus diversus TaxID=327109 RepID=UPI00240961A0|nr:speckle-type POZ protein-like [Uloborus diversus]